MIERVHKEIRSRELVVKLYDRWVRQRQKRPDITVPTDEAGLKKLGIKNYVSELVVPRKNHLAELKKVSSEISVADKVALLVMLELPVLETSALLQRLSRQVSEDAEALYFSKDNLRANCGCGCG